MRKELARELAENLEGPTFIDTSFGQVLEMSSTLHKFPFPKTQAQKTKPYNQRLLIIKSKNQETPVNSYMGNTVPKTDVWHFFVKYFFI
jgi:hypothetical protein